MSPNIDREEAIRILYEKNESLKALLDQIIATTATKTDKEIIGQIQAISELEGALNGSLTRLILSN